MEPTATHQLVPWQLPESTTSAPAGHDTAVTALVTGTRTDDSTHVQVMPTATVCNYTQGLSKEMLGRDAALKPTNLLWTHLNRNKGSQLLNICHSLTLLDLVALHHHIKFRKIVHNLEESMHNMSSACSCTTADT